MLVADSVLWWIGNLVLLLVIAPVVLLFANRVLRPVFEIKSYADDVVEHAGNLLSAVHQADRLNRTRDVAKQVERGATRYASALRRATSS